MTTENEIHAAAKQLETAEAAFDRIETEYFRGKAKPAALRVAWSARETARLALQRAHMGMGHATNPR